MGGWVWVWVSEFLTTAESIGQHFAVGEFEYAAGGDSACESSDANGIILQEVGDEQGRAISFECGVGRHDDFGDALFSDAVHELVNGEIFGTDAFEWSDASTEHVVHASPDA